MFDLAIGLSPNDEPLAIIREAEEERVYQQRLIDVRDIISYIGDDPTREGLVDTPKRVLKAYGKIFGGYKMTPEEALGRTFEADGYDQMVMLKDIEFYSTCEHHMIPFFGKIHVAYIPNHRIVGISKLARLVEVYARRLQVQERLTCQVADSIMKVLEPKGAMVVCEAQHLCMLARGVEKQNSVMVTSTIKGAFRDNPNCREEFFGLLRGGNK